MSYLATFHTHYGAMSLNRKLKKMGTQTQMMPVPRCLSASCGVCVRFEASDPNAAEGAEDLEAVYFENEGGYTLIYSGDQ